MKRIVTNVWNAIRGSLRTRLAKKLPVIWRSDRGATRFAIFVVATAFAGLTSLPAIAQQTVTDSNGDTFQAQSNGDISVSASGDTLTIDSSTIDGRISANATDIANNTSDISVNSADISTNSGYISTNTDAINTNTSDISTNKDAITTNTGNINTLQTSVANSSWTLKGDTGSKKIVNGDTATFAGGSNGNITTSVSGHTLTITLSDSPRFGGVEINPGDNGKITGVAAGAVAAGSTEVVNGGQLYATNQNVAANASDINTNTGAIAALNTAAGTPITFSGNDNSAGPATAKLGQTIAIQGGASTSGNYSGDNIKTVSDTGTGTLNIQMANAPRFGNIVINDSGKITGVAAGGLAASSKDAVNGAQINALGSSIALDLGGGASFNSSTGKVVQPTYDFVDQAGAHHPFNDVGGALNYLSSGSALDSGIKYFHAESTLADSVASGTDAVAIGPETTAEGINGFAAGHGAGVAAGISNGIALGTQALSGGDSATAIGDEAQAIADGSIAMGLQTIALGQKATSIGAKGTPIATLSLSYDTNGTLTTINGVPVTATGDPLVADGTYSPTGSASITAIAGVPVTQAQVNSFVGALMAGTNIARGADSVSLGVGTIAAGNSAVAIGNTTSASVDAVSIGHGTVAAGQAVSIGPGAAAGASRSFAGGDSATVAGPATDGVAIGHNAQAGKASNLNGDPVGAGAVAIGNGANAYMDHDVAIGDGAGAGSQGAKTADVGNVYLGYQAGAGVTNGGHNVAMGYQAGQNRADSSDENIAIGNQAAVEQAGQRNIAIGRYASNAPQLGLPAIDANDTVVVGTDASAAANDTVAIGHSASATGSAGLALGLQAQAPAGDSVAIGSKSIADGTINNISDGAYLTSQQASAIFSVGQNAASGNQVLRRVVNVAGGVNSNDAVNVAQLKGAQQSVAGIIGDTTVAADGTMTYSGGGSGQYSTVTQYLDAIAAGTANLPALNDVVKYNGSSHTDMTLGGAGGTAIHNVAPGTAGTDAVNLNQLNTAKPHFLAINSASTQANYDNTGATGADAIAIGPNTQAGAASTDEAAVAIGKNAQAEKIHTIAIGQDTLSRNTNSVAVGYQARADGTDSVSIGHHAQVEGQGGNPDAVDGVAIGTESHVTRVHGTSIGSHALVEADQGQAIGYLAHVHPDAINSQAIGREAEVDFNAQNAMAYGTQAYVSPNSNNAMAMGTQSRALAVNAYAEGNLAQSSAASAYAVGDTARSSGLRAFAIGSTIGTDETTASATNAYAVGAAANSAANDSYAIGTHAVAVKGGPAAGEDAFAIGSSAMVNQDNAYAIGNTAKSTATSAYAVGRLASSSAENAFAFGTSSVSDKADAYALGSGATADGVNAYAFGNTAVASGQNAVAFGTGSAASGQGAIAFGNGAGASGAAINGIAIGTGAKTTNEKAYAFGNGATASGKNSLAFGSDSIVAGAGSGAFGDPNTVNATGAYVVGNDNLIDTSASNSFVLGNNVTLDQNWQASSVVLGNNSDSHQVHVGTSATQVTLNGITQTFAGPASKGNGFVSVGSKGGERQIENVAAGEISVTSTDAINGSQLYATNQAVQKPITFHGDTGTDVDRTLNTTLNVQGGATGSLTGGNIGVEGNGTNALNIKLAQNIDLGAAGSVTMGNDTLDQHGLAIAGGPKFGDNGISAGGQQIKGVADGVDANDAVNVSQLTAAQTDLTNKGLDFAPNAGGSVHRDLGQILDIKGGATATGNYSDANIKTVATANGIDIQLADNPVFDSVTTGNSVLNNGGLTVNNGTTSTSYGPIGMSIAGGPSIIKSGIDAAGNKIVNVAPGTLGASSTDAVNGSQLYAVQQAANAGWNLSANGGTGVNIAPGTTLDVAQGTAGPAGNIQISQDTTSGNLTVALNPVLSGLTSVAITNGPTIDADGIDMGNNKITNLTAGTNLTDAVNVSQLTTAAAKATTEVQSGTNIANVTKTTGGNGQSIYTVNADGASVSAGSGDITVTPTGPDANNVTDYAVDLAVNTKADIAQGVAAKTAVDNTGLTFNGDSGSSNVRKLGDQVAIIGDNNITTTGAGDGVGIALNHNLDLTSAGSVKTGNSVLDNSGLTVDDGTGNNATITADGTSVTDGTNTTVYGPNGVTINGGDVGLTKDGLDNGGNKIVNVAAGTNPTDGVNVSQLTTQGANLANLGLDFALNAGGTVHRNLGDTLDIKGGASTTGSYSDANVKTVATANGVDIQLADNPVFNSVITGDSALDTNGLTIAGGPSVTKSGIDAAGTKITNLIAGTDLTDAVNVSQLTTAAAKATTEVQGGTNIANVTKTTGGNGQSIYTVNADGATVSVDSGLSLHKTGPDANNVTDYKVGLSAATQTSLANADSALQSVQTQVDGSNVKRLTKSDDVANFESGKNIALSDDNGAIKIATADDVNFDSVTLGSAGPVLGNDGAGNLKVGDGSGNPVKVTNVAPGTVGSTSTDAVNGSQLYDVQQAATAGWDLSAQGSNATNVGPGDSVDLNNADGNILVSKAAGSNDVTFGLANTVTVGSNGGAHPVTINGDTGTIGGLTNKTFNPSSITSGQAASEDQLAQINSGLTSAGLDFAGNDGSAIHKNLGEQLAIVGGGVIGGTYSADNIKTVNNGGKLEIQMADTPRFQGTDMGGGKITNVANGNISSTSTDAVNGSQLYDVQQAATAGWTVADADSNSNSIGPNGKVEFDGDNNLTVTESGNDDDATVTVALNKQIDLGSSGSVTTGDSVLDNGGLTVGNGTNKSVYGPDGVTITGGPNNSVAFTGAGLDNGGNKIVNVAPGTLSAASTDAVNGSQLFGTNQSVADILGGNAGVNPDGTIKAPTDIGGTGKDNVNDAIQAVNSAATAGWTVADADSNSSSIGPNGKVEFDGDNNLTVTESGNDDDATVTVALNKQIDLGSSGSVTTGDTKVDNSGITLSNGPNNTVALTDAGLDNGGNKIVNVASGLGGQPLASATPTNGANIGDLQTVAGNLGKASNGGGFGLKDENGNEIEHDLGDSITIKGDGQNIATSVDGGALQVALGNDLSIGQPGVEDGHLAVDGKDGVSGVALNGADGSIDLTNPTGKTTNLSVADGQPELDGNGGSPRLVYTDDAGQHQIANLGDGLRFVGNKGGTIDKKLNETLTVKGSLGNTADASDANLRVDNVGGELHVMMARNLADIDSLTLTNGPKISGNGGNLDVGGGKITNLAAGTNPNDAVNFSQLNAVASTANKPLTFATGDGSTFDRKLGTQVAVLGDGDPAAVNPTGEPGNIHTTSNPGDDGLTVRLSKNLELTGHGSVHFDQTRLDDTGLTIAGGPSVLDSGISAGNINLTDVKAGQDNTDAVNVAQLKGVTTALGGGANVDHNGNVIAPSYTLPDAANPGATTTYNDVGSALNGLYKSGLNFTANDASAGDVHRDIGQTLAINGGATTAGSYSGANIKTVTDPTTGAIEIQMADTPEFDGADMGGSRITNVADGQAPDDAVNKGQLDAATSGLTTAGLDFVDDDGNTVHRDLGDTLKITGGADTTKLSDDNIGVVADGNDGLQIKLARDVSGLNSVAFASGPVLSSDGNGNLMVGDASGGLVKITNVAPGIISATSTDAVNGSQLYGANKDLADVLGGNAGVNPDGSLKKPTDIGGTGKDNVNDAIAAANSAANAGWNLTANGTNSSNVGPNDTVDLGNTDGNIKVTKAAGSNAVSIDLADNVNVDSVTAGNTIVDNGGVTITGGPDNDVHLGNGGLDNGGNKITNVAAGTDGSDAVNVSQLEGALGGSVGQNGNVQYDVNGQTYNNVGDALDAATIHYFSVTGDQGNNGNDTKTPVDNFHNEGAVTRESVAIGYGAKAQADGATSVGTGNVVSGEQSTAVGYDNRVSGAHSGAFGDPNVVSGSGSYAVGNNNTIKADNAFVIGNNVTVGTGLNDSVALGDGSTVTAATATPSGTVAGNTYNYAGGNPVAGDVVSVGSSGHERQIQNVAAGRVNATSTDAINGSQLYATNQAVGSVQSQIDNINQHGGGMFQVSADSNGSPDASGTNSVAGGAGAVASGSDSTAVGNGSKASGSNSVALGSGSQASRADAVSVGSKGDERQITNVAAGTQGTDAVNVNQLSRGLNQVFSLNRNYTDKRFHEADNRASAGAASAMAMTGIPQAYRPGLNTAGVGVGSYRGESAFAVGLSSVTDNGRYTFKLNGSANTQGDLGVSAGVGFNW